MPTDCREPAHDLGVCRLFKSTLEPSELYKLLKHQLHGQGSRETCRSIVSDDRHCSEFARCRVENEVNAIAQETGSREFTFYEKKRRWGCGDVRL